MYKKHEFIPIDRFYRNFKDLTNDRTKKDLIGFEIVNAIIAPADFNRVGYGQYVVNKLSDKLISHVKFLNKDEEIEHIKFNKDLLRLSELEQFSELKPYEKIKLVFTMLSQEDEVLDYKNPLVIPSGKFKASVVGFLVKE